MSTPILPGGLGRIEAPDARDRAFPMRAVLPSRDTLRTRIYRTGPVLNQGMTGTCVGHAWRGFLSAALMMTKSGPDAFAIYRRACQIDEWSDNDLGDLNWGTSVRAGAKVLQEAGHIGEYRWAWSANDVAAWLSADKGVVVLGTDFTEGMASPGKDGYMHVTGDVLGGHAYLCVGYNVKRDAFRVLNSWGMWAQNGRAWLPWADLEMLLRAGGEAATATEVAMKGMTP